MAAEYVFFILLHVKDKDIYVEPGNMTDWENRLSTG